MCVLFTSSANAIGVTSFVVRNAPSHFTAPVHYGLMFALDDPSQVAATAKYNNFSAAEFRSVFKSMLIATLFFPP